MNNVTRAMDHENCFWQYRLGRTQLVCMHHWVSGSKPDQGGVHIRVVQLVS